MNTQISEMIKKINKASQIQIPEARRMTSKQLLPRFNDLLDELKQINGLIDFDDPAEEALNTLIDVATDTKIEMETST